MQYKQNILLTVRIGKLIIKLNKGIAIVSSKKCKIFTYQIRIIVLYARVYSTTTPTYVQAVRYNVARLLQK